MSRPRRSGTVGVVTEQTISLPRGGGAIKGIGETFAPDLHTGTGNLTVPVPVLPGRNGYQPDVTLTYSTGAGNGPYGLGWAVSVPGVVRKTSRGLPSYDDTTDTFLLSGAEDLVPVEVAGGVTRYRPRTEGLFARIEHHRGEAGNFWRVSTRDGQVSLYGTPRPPDAGAGWRDPAAVTDPSDHGRVFAWRLSLTTDPFGNRIAYEHRRDEDPDRAWTQSYLSAIRYVDSGDDYLAEVRLEHAERPDPFSDRRATFDLHTRLRCERISVHSAAVPGGPVRTTTLRYDDSAANGISLLTEIVIAGHDGDRTEALPPLRFGYTGFTPEIREFGPVTGAELPGRSLADPTLALVDLSGNGLPDLVEIAGATRWWRNLGGGRFDRPRTMRSAPAALSGPGAGPGAGPAPVLADADGDGRVDLVTADGYYPLRPDGEWDTRLFRRYEVAPSFAAGDPQVRLVDLDGDGVTDALRTGSRFECFFADRERGWDRFRTVERGRYPDFPDVSFADPRVHLADMTGDGLADIVLVHDGQVEFWPSLGGGDWDRRQAPRECPRFPYGYDPRRVLVGDVDGDGAADVLYVDDESVTVWVNRGGRGFAPPVTVKGTPRVTDADAVRLVDLLGTGVAGILWTSDDRPPYFLDLTGGTKPGLLSEVDNSAGAVTRIRYASSVDFPAGAGFLPFPVRVVAAVQVDDLVSGGRLTTTFDYAHGHWDGAEQEFRGFGRVDQRDTEQQATGPLAPVQTRTWFHLGPVGPEHGDWVEPDLSGEFWPGDPALLGRPAELAELLDRLPRRERRDAVRALGGRALRTEVYQLDGTDRADRPVTVTESVPALRQEAAGVFFPFVAAGRTTQWERGDDPMTRLDFTGDHDRYGQPRSRLAIAVPRGRDVRAAGGGEPCLVTRSTTEYADRDDEHRYLTGRVARSVSVELVDAGRVGVLALPTADLPTRPVAEIRTYYDGVPFEGLPLGRLGEHGAMSRTESLVLTGEILAAAYGPDLPPYLAGGRTDDYPDQFLRQLPAAAGYAVHDGGWWAVTGQQLDPRGLPVAVRDAAGAVTTLAHDERGLLTAATDPAGLTTTASYDDRSFAVREVTDPNGIRTAVRYTPLGLLDRSALLGRRGEADSLDQPTVRLSYDLHAWRERGQPLSVRTVRRVHHAGSPDVPPDRRDETQVHVEFTDGFGRLLQTRTQAADLTFGDPVFGASDVDAAGDVIGGQRLDRVVVSGWQTYDGKGRVIERYQPFFGTGLGYAPPGEAELGRKVVTGYDARGRVVRTAHPDGSQQRVVHGVPLALADPDRYAPTAWEAYSYDANDNAGRTHPGTAAGYRSHWDTPSSVLVDALGRTVQAVARNGTDPADAHRTRSAYDISGRLVAHTDELGRVAVRNEYDLAGRTLRTEQLDCGVRTAVFDAAGRAVESRDARGALVLHGYDPAGRPERAWARDAAGEPVTLRERLGYGSDVDANLAGRVVRHHDEAGVAALLRCDVDGNPVETTRRVVGDEQLLAGPAVDWEPAAGQTLEQREAALLDPAEYRMSSSFDALGRPRLLVLPADATGHRTSVRPDYDRAGALRSVDLDGTTYLEHVGYDALGRRTLAVHGNGTLTRYGYDPDSFRPTRLRTQRFSRIGPLAFRPTGAPVQDLTYAHDLVGNLLSTLDRTPGSGLPAQPDALLRRFDYDPRYRLLTASGREHDLPQPAPWADVLGTDPTRARAYTESYGYDPAGNMLELRHTGRATRTYQLAAGSNRLAALTVGQTPFDYGYDAAGNLVRETDSRRFEWDAAGRLRRFSVQVGSAVSVHARYAYDAAGQRVRKVVRTQGGELRSVVYLTGGFEQTRTAAGGPPRDSTLVHVLDGTRRVARVRSGTPDPDDATPPVTYELTDHLGSAVVTLDAAGAGVSTEEFTPYGETSFGGHARKRYRFTGKERDEESSLSYHGVRYYAPWLARWISPDPAGTVDGANLYRYARGNPVGLVDRTGTQSAPPDQQQATGGPPAASGTFYPPPDSRVNVDSTHGPAAGPAVPGPAGPLPPMAYVSHAEKQQMGFDTARSGAAAGLAMGIAALSGASDDRVLMLGMLAAAASGVVGSFAGARRPPDTVGADAYRSISHALTPPDRHTAEAPPTARAADPDNPPLMIKGVLPEKLDLAKPEHTADIKRLWGAEAKGREYAWTEMSDGTEKDRSGGASRVRVPATGPEVDRFGHTHQLSPKGDGAMALPSTGDAKAVRKAQLRADATVVVLGYRWPFANEVLLHYGAPPDMTMMRLAVPAGVLLDRSKVSVPQIMEFLPPKFPLGDPL